MFDAIAASSIGKQEEENASKHNGGQEHLPYKIRTGGDKEGLICEALLTGNLEAAVELCMQAGKTSEALILAMNGKRHSVECLMYRQDHDPNHFCALTIQVDRNC